jgi:hypothetical protein
MVQLQLDVSWAKHKKAALKRHLTDETSQRDFYLVGSGATFVAPLLSQLVPAWS